MIVKSLKFGSVLKSVIVLKLTKRIIKFKMLLHDAKRQRRLHRIANQIQHAKRLRIAKVSFPLPEKVSWWAKLLRILKSFLNAKPRNTTFKVPAG